MIQVGILDSRRLQQGIIKLLEVLNRRPFSCLLLFPVVAYLKSDGSMCG